MAQLASTRSWQLGAQSIPAGLREKDLRRNARRQVNTRLLTARPMPRRKGGVGEGEAAAKGTSTGDADVKVGAQYLAFGDTASGQLCSVGSEGASPKAANKRRRSTKPASCWASRNSEQQQGGSRQGVQECHA
jgi:hypothetical protein